MPNEVMPTYDEESPFIPPRDNTEEETLNFFNTPASTAGGSHASSTMPQQRNRFPLPSDSPFTERTSNRAPFAGLKDGICVFGTSDGSGSRFEQQSSRHIASASPQKSKFVRATDNDVFATNIQVALRKEDYGEPGSSEYRKNTQRTVT
eukprot:scaffold16433_cov32-Cyclotella_meneghiniana.AAC.1